MVQCEDCGGIYPKLSALSCNKCKKIKAASSEAEKEAIRGRNQCEGCSAVYGELRGPLCGMCLNDPKAMSSDPKYSEIILEQAAKFKAQSSESRLGQQSNKGLEKARDIKEKTAQLRKQNKAEIVQIDTTILYYPKNGGVAKKLQILPLVRNFEGTTLMLRVIRDIRRDCEKAWNDCPLDTRAQMGALNFDDAKFGIRQSGNKATSLELTKDVIESNIEYQFTHLKHERLITESDFKARKIPIQVVAYETRDYGDEDEDDFVSTKSSNRANRRKSITSIGKGSKARPSATKRGAVEEIDASPPGLMPAPYISNFRPQKRIRSGDDANVEPPVEFVKFKFFCTTKVVDGEGTVKDTTSKESEEIEIAKDWFASIGDKPKNGYLSKGFTKFAFRGRIGSKEYAIFQCKPDRVSDSDNDADLRDELHLLCLGQYFADSFARRANAYGIKIHDLKFNFKDAFVGEVPAFLMPTGDARKDCALLFPTFLACPLLKTTDEYEEKKFSGGNGIAHNKDDLGRLVDAFAHHVFVDSQGTMVLTDLQGIIGPFPEKSVCLYDPQAHTQDQNAGFFDGGEKAIGEWRAAHENHCNIYCRKLGLQDATIDINRPPVGSPKGKKRQESTSLRIGF